MFEYCKANLLLVVVIPILLITTAASYYRFYILDDFFVAYEGDCDPETASCFVGCDNDDCSEVYYYNLIERHAAEIRTVCGTDITDCNQAMSCPDTDAHCQITFCTDGESCDEIN